MQCPFEKNASNGKPKKVQKTYYVSYSCHIYEKLYYVFLSAQAGHYVVNQSTTLGTWIVY